MYFSAKGEYGIMAVLDLALANGSAPVQAKAIADRQGIPLRFLEHILSALKHAGLVESERGAHGGYRLAKPASEIRIGDVIQAVDGPIAMPTRTLPRLRNGNGHRTAWLLGPGGLGRGQGVGPGNPESYHGCR